MRKLAVAGIKVAMASTVAFGGGAYGGNRAIHAIGANHHFGWRALEYVAGMTTTGTAAAATVGLAVAGVLAAKEAKKAAKDFGL
jgi:hypothetical protein